MLKLAVSYGLKLVVAGVAIGHRGVRVDARDGDVAVWSDRDGSGDVHADLGVTDLRRRYRELHSSSARHEGDPIIALRCE